MLKNEKYKGDARLQKYYVPEYLKKISKRNDGVLDSYYIEHNHTAIISEDLWGMAQDELKRRAQEKGNIDGQTEKYTKRYLLTGMLYCSKCGAPLKRRTWNSKASCKKIVWQCSNYIKNGKNVCEGTTIEDSIVSEVNIKGKTTIKEEIRNGKKHYIYTSESEQD
jgi:hypothetical protein